MSKGPEKPQTVEHAGVVEPPRSSGKRTIGRRRAPITARGEPMVWLSGGCVATAVIVIVFLLGFIFWQGMFTFWPKPLIESKLADGKTVLGEPARSDTYTLDGKVATRILYKTGNYDLTGDDFTWVNDSSVIERAVPKWGLVIERVAWLNAYGTLEGLTVDGVTLSDPEQAWLKFNELHRSIRNTVKRINRIEKKEMGEISRAQDDLRLELRGVEIKYGKDSPEYRNKVEVQGRKQEELSRQYQSLRNEAAGLWKEASRARLVVRTSQGKIIPADRSKPNEPMFVWQVVRAYPANQLGFWGKAGTYFSRWWEYLSDDPREANMEGGVFPAIVGTVLLTLIMIIFVVPLGVIAAVYLESMPNRGGWYRWCGSRSITWRGFRASSSVFLASASSAIWWGAASTACSTPSDFPTRPWARAPDLGVADFGAAHAPGSYRGHGRGPGGRSPLHARRRVRLRG